MKNKTPCAGDVMKKCSLIIVAFLWLYCGTSFGAADAPPATLTLGDLVNHPERWPATVTLKRDYRFSSGAVAHQGDKARVLKFDGSQVQLAAGKIMFRDKPESCGFVEAANESWAALTPAQRAVDPTTLANDPSLWPLTVTTNTSINSSFGKVAAGTEVGVNNVAADGVEIAIPNSLNRLQIDFEGSDILVRARKLAGVEPGKRPSRIVSALGKMLVTADGTPYHEDLSNKQIFALYFGAGWCPPCRVFSPDFVKYVNETMPKHPELAVIFLNDDKQIPEMLTYMQQEKMPFPATNMKDWNKNNLLTSYSSQLIPQLVIVDRFGKVLATSDDNKGRRLEPKETLAALTRILSKPALN